MTAAPEDLEWLQTRAEQDPSTAGRARPGDDDAAGRRDAASPCPRRPPPSRPSPLARGTPPACSWRTPPRSRRRPPGCHTSADSDASCHAPIPPTCPRGSSAAGARAGRRRCRLPSLAALHDILETAYHASLLREESRSLRFRLLVAAPSALHECVPAERAAAGARVRSVAAPVGRRVAAPRAGCRLRTHADRRPRRRGGLALHLGTRIVWRAVAPAPAEWTRRSATPRCPMASSCTCCRRATC